MSQQNNSGGFNFPSYAKLLGGEALVFLGENWDEIVGKRVTGLKKAAQLSIGGSLVLFLLGLLLGKLGDYKDWQPLIGFAESSVNLACVVGAAMFAVLTIRLTLYMGVATVATHVMPGKLAEKIGSKPIDAEKAKAYSRILAAVTAWAAGFFLLVLLLNQVDAAWRNMVAILVIFVACIILAGGTIAWAEKPIFRYVLYFGSAVILGLTILFYASPTIAGGMRTAAYRVLGRSAVTTGVDRDADIAADRQLYAAFHGRRSELRLKGAEKCGGYCPEDVREVEWIEESLRRLNNGTYWKAATAEPEKEDVSQSDGPSRMERLRNWLASAFKTGKTEPATAPASAPNVPTPATPPTKVTRSAEPTACHGSCEQSNLDGVWAELDKYPDIR